MNESLRVAIEALPLAAQPVLEARYAALFGRPARVKHRAYLQRRIAWRLQEQQVGGLSALARARLAELTAALDPLGEWALRAQRRAPTGVVANTSAGRRSRTIRLPGAGSFIRRLYQGREIVVRVLDDGFEFDGRRFRSLTAIAQVVSGAHWNGLLFFGLVKQQRKDLRATA